MTLCRSRPIASEAPTISRAICLRCSHRFESAADATEGELAACPACHMVTPLEREPLDEHWWRWITGQPHLAKVLRNPPDA